MLKRLSLILCLVLICTQIDAGFFGDAFNTITGGGGILPFLGSGGASGPVESSLQPAIDRYQQANAASIALLDKSLSARIDQFGNTLGTTLLISEQQMDEILKSSINLMDEGLQENIQLLDQSLHENVGDLGGQLTSVSYSFSNSLWKVFKATLLLIAFLVLCAIIQQFLVTFNAPKPGTTKRAIVKRYLFPLIVSFTAVVAIYFASPNIFGRYVDSSYKKQVSDLESRLVDADQSMNYIEAFYVASQLSALDNADGKYKYYKDKYEILKDYVYRPKLSLFDPSYIFELGQKLARIESWKDKIGEADPDLYVLDAIYFYNAFPDQRGALAAAFAADKALKEDSIRHSGDHSNSSPLMVIAENYIENYNDWPIDDDSVAARFIREQLHDSWQGRSFPTRKISAGPISTVDLIYQFDATVRDRLLDDQEKLLAFLGEDMNAKKELIGVGVRNAWDGIIANTVNNDREMGSLYISSSMKFDDSYVSYIDTALTNMPGIGADASLLAASAQAQLSIFPDVAHRNSYAGWQQYSELSDYRKILINKLLYEFSFKSKSVVIATEAVAQARRSSRLDSFVLAYQNFKAQTGNKQLDSATFFHLYAQLAISAASIGLYGEKAGIRRAFGMVILDELKAKLLKPAASPIVTEAYSRLRKTVSDQYWEYRAVIL